MPNNSAQFSLDSMDVSEAWKYERERLESFYRALFGIDAAAMVFFLIVKPGPILPTTLPFTLGPFFPLKCQVVALAILSAVILFLRSINLLYELRPNFLRWFRLIGMLSLIASLFVIAWGGIAIFCHPEYLPPRHQ